MTHACLACGRLINVGERCVACRLPKASIEDRAGHNRLRSVVLAEEKTCWLCQKPGTPDDPLTLDHVLARSRGGCHVRSNGRAGHRSCNSAKRDRDPKPTGIRVVS